MLYYYIKIREAYSALWRPFKQEGKIPIFCDEKIAKKVAEDIISSHCMIMPISYLPTQKESSLYKENFFIMDMIPVI